MTLRLRGREAICTAEALGLRLNKYADQTEGTQTGLTVEEAREVAREDPRLVYVDVDLDSLVLDDALAVLMLCVRALTAAHVN
jgi:hypothetical protein